MLWTNGRIWDEIIAKANKPRGDIPQRIRFDCSQLLRQMRDDYQQRIVELEAEVERLRSLLESLTPGGSEFSGSPDRCVEWARERLSTTGKLAAENTRLRGLLPSADEKLMIESCARLAVQHVGGSVIHEAMQVIEWLDKLGEADDE